MTNLVVAQALAGNFSHVLIDEYSHPSLADAARLFDCPVLRCKHRDAEDAARAGRRCGPGASVILLTDGMFARDGSVAPLADYLRALPKDAWVLVDDAHGAGVLGHTGKGSLENAGLPRRRIIQTVTLSKAFGAYGGAILATPKLRQRIFDRSRMFIGSTPLPLPLAHAALQGVGLLKTGSRLRHRLRANAEKVRKSLRDAGVPIPASPSPIISIFAETSKEIAGLNSRLLRAGIYPPFLSYPGGPARGFFRFVISSEHSPVQLNSLIETLASAPWQAFH
jgi:7-keto-8-aminopelargonate synthetase-like enzyme